MTARQRPTNPSSAAPKAGNDGRAARVRTFGFGFDPAQSPYHFVVVADRRGDVTIVERFAWGTDDSESSPAPAQVSEASGDGDQPKATLSAYLWGRVAEHAAAEFNRRLRDAGLKAGAWAKTETLLAPHFGKELTLLAWAVEDHDADPTPIPAIVANWSGLAPEERWWFYTTINATGPHPDHGRDRGWRRAIKIAFAENPVQLPSSALLIGPMPAPASRRGKARAAPNDPPTAPDATQGRLWTTDDQP